jgi:selenocysteine-specific elongation factor
VRVLATAGHVDHGKSSLVLALTGTDPDRFAEEKRRGLTIDLGFAHTTLPSGEEISLVDVPGHGRFLRNMLAGVGAVDACIFVVAATEGWKQQSEEHLRILQLLGIRHGVVALTKVDLVDEEWREIATMEVSAAVTGTFLDGARIVPVATTGEHPRGLADLVGAIDVLVAETPAALDRHRARLWVDRSFAAKGSGTIVTGTLAGGSLRNDDIVSIADARGTRLVRVRSMQRHGHVVEEVGPGNRVALNLSGIAHTDLERGAAVIREGQWHLTDRFDATLDVLAALDHDVSRRGAYQAYLGSLEASVKLRVLGASTIAPGTSGDVRVFLPHAVPLLPGDRFILRESGRDETVGGGRVLDVEPVLRASKARPDDTIERVIAERGWVEVDVLERLTGLRRSPDLGRWAVAPEILVAEQSRWSAAIDAADDAGVDLAPLSERERAVIESLDDVIIESGRARSADAIDPFADHPLAATILAGGYAPEIPPGLDRAVVRELVRRGVLVEREQLLFHEQTVGAAARLAAELLVESPDGFTVSQFRERSGASRKWAVPLLAELDHRGVTRRRDQLRVAGPRLPTAPESGSPEV